MRRHDYPAFMAQLDPEYQEERFVGKIKSRREAESGFQQVFRDWTRFRTQKHDILSLTVHGPKATVIVERLAEGDVNDSLGGYGPKGQSHVVKSDIVEIDTWHRVQRSWLLRSRQISMGKVWVDGKAREGTPAHED